MRKQYILHIETAPLPMEQLITAAPTFRAAANIKDPKKIEEDIEKRKNKYFEEAAYNAATAKICALAWMDISDMKVQSVNSEFEEDLLPELFDMLTKPEYAHTYTFRGLKFVYPFICRRALTLGINFFDVFFGEKGHRLHFDIAQIWACGSSSHPESLEEITKVLSINYMDNPQPYYKLRAADAHNATNHAGEQLTSTINAIDAIRRRF